MAFVKFASRHMQVIAAVGSGVIFAASVYPHTLGLNRYRNVFAQYKDGKEQPLDRALEDLVEKVAFSIAMTPKEQVELQFFPVPGIDTSHQGSLKLRFGALVGLPATFSCTSVDQVPTQELCLPNQDISWESDAGQQLLQSIILSPKAKAFAIAREIQYVHSNYVWVEGFMRTGFYFLAYVTGHMVNNIFHLRTRMKPWGRFGVYGLIGTIYLFLYITIEDTYMCYRDNKVDYKTSRLGKFYAEGGEEFYNKMLERNKALRSLMGKEGQTLYTLFGNDMATLRRPHVQLSVRRDNLKKYAKGYDLVQGDVNQQ